MDGGNYIEMKQEEIDKRAARKIERVVKFNKYGMQAKITLPLPLFLYPLFYEVIKESENVQFIICDQ